MTNINDLKTVEKISTLFKVVKELAPRATLTIHHVDMSILSNEYIIEDVDNGKVRYKSARRNGEEYEGLVFFN